MRDGPVNGHGGTHEHSVFLPNLHGEPDFFQYQAKAGPLAVPINQLCSIDFLHNPLRDDRIFRLLNVFDDFNREELGIAVDLSLPWSRVIRLLEQIIEWHGNPAEFAQKHGAKANS